MKKIFKFADGIEINLEDISLIENIHERGTDIGLVLKPTAWHEYSIQLKNGNEITRRSKSWRETFFTLKPKKGETEKKENELQKLSIEKGELIHAWKFLNENK